MKVNSAGVTRIAAGLAGLLVLGWVLTVQAAKPEPQGFPTDWSHQHLIFSQPATQEQVMRVANDPRYWQQWFRRNFARVVPDSHSGDSNPALPGDSSLSDQKVHDDWSQNLGAGGSVGAGNFPAKFTFRITVANCGSAFVPDYVVFTTGLAGSSLQATIAAFDNLYSGCGGTVPSVYWAYNTGTGAKVIGSPTISGDGTQVAFVQTSGGNASLVLLKWKSSSSETIGGPLTLTAVTNAQYRACTAPCMTEVPLMDNHPSPVNDLTSSPFADYTNDIIWVGGASSWLIKVTGVFRGTPAEVATGGFPVHVNAVTLSALTNPVFDAGSGNVFVGDLGGVLYRVVATTGAVTRSLQLDHGVGLVSGPIVDSTAGMVYAFASSDGGNTCPGPAACSAVFQFATNFAALTGGTKKVTGTSSATPNALYLGAFDNAYLTSTAPPTGSLYVCGNTGGPPILYRIPIAANIMGAVVNGPVLSNATTGCSPVLDVANPNATGGATEWIFAGIQASGLGNNCASGGCAMNFKDQSWTPNTAYTVGQQVLDTHFQIQVVRVAGTSKATTPAWSVALGGTTADNTVRWLNQGPQSAAHSLWASGHTYSVGNEILDTNNNIQLVITAGLSGGTTPTWNANVNGGTVDNVVRWRNVGTVATASISAAGGTSAIIMDNTVGAGTLAGASQIYYSTQSNQSCGAPPGGCAVQASQPVLQ